MSKNVLATYFKPILYAVLVFEVLLFFHYFYNNTRSYSFQSIGNITKDSSITRTILSFKHTNFIQPVNNVANYFPITIIVSSYLDCRFEDNRAKIRVIGIRNCEHQNDTMYAKLKINKREIDLLLEPSLLRKCPWHFAKGIL